MGVAKISNTIVRRRDMKEAKKGNWDVNVIPTQYHLNHRLLSEQKYLERTTRAAGQRGERCKSEEVGYFKLGNVRDREF
jgi:hypothetical protein